MWRRRAGRRSKLGWLLMGAGLYAWSRYRKAKREQALHAARSRRSIPHGPTHRRVHDVEIYDRPMPKSAAFYRG
jgi:hypothetical protein